MDWSKAKNILIVAFIITNLILAYVLIDNRASETTMDEKFINNVKEKLLVKDIHISPDIQIPLGKPSLSKLNVEYQVYSPTEIAEAFLGDYNYNTSITKDSYVYKKNNQVLTISHDNKKIVYVNNNDESDIVTSPDLSEKRVHFLIEVFLNEKGFADDDFKLINYNFDKMPYTLEYVKVYKGIYVEKTWMKIEIDKSGVRKFERMWIDIDGVDTKVSINSAPNALLTLLSKEDISEKTISDMSLCYYLDSEEKDNLDSEKIIAGQATPAWRIEFSDGTKEFLR
ncbi:hypothetical protein [Sporosalibacterium faouarense]|uniref:hypothetical protein n=1 Tax=Sporosalibacterium faouarense TaxID=516123 RepID=UPI00141D14F3|nr:hypothetical protein [Sporosalibacterium faouarense]MTI46244.1 hypothetical protein [Bacillota bacterium]